MKAWGRSQLLLNNIYAFASVLVGDEIVVVVTFESPFRTAARYQKIKTELKNIGLKNDLIICPLTRR